MNKRLIPKIYRGIIYSLLFIFLSGCHPLTDVVMPDGRHFPQKPAFTILPKGDYKDSDLDYNSIYYNRYEMILDDVVQVSYNYYRFWPNGRVLIAHSTQLPTREDAENFSGAYIGYYQVEGHNLRMEFFIPDSGIWNWGYERAYAIIKNNCIIDIKSEDRGIVTTERMVFVKYDLGKLMRQPDW